MMQRWREKLKYIEAGMIISALILFVATLIFGDNLTLEVIAFIVGTVLFSRVIERMDKKRNRENETPGRGRTERYCLRINPVSQRKND